MKKFGFIIVFLLLTYSVFGQQMLWSTVRNDDARYVSLNNVTREVLNFYDQYDYYYDFTGFDKKTFLQTFGEGTNDWDWIDEIDEMTVIAMRVSIEVGFSRNSVVYVICIGKNSVDMIAFSNALDSGFNSTSSSRRSRFESWFRTILN